MKHTYTNKELQYAIDAATADTDTASKSIVTRRKPRPASTETVNWSKQAKDHGLHISGISIGHVRKLLEIQTEPLPVVPRSRGKHKQTSPSPKVSIGPLVTNGFLRLEEGFYRITWKGEFYLKQLREAGMI